MSKPHLKHYVDALNPTQRYLVTEFVDNYEDGLMGRRDLLERVLRITGSAAAAAGTLLALGCAPAASGPPAVPTATPAPARSGDGGGAAGTQPALGGGERPGGGGGAGDVPQRGRDGHGVPGAPGGQRAPTGR